MTQIPSETIKEWGLAGLSQAEQVQILDRIGRLVYQAVLVRSLDILSENEQIELDKLLDIDETTTDEVLAFLGGKIPTFDLMRKEEIAKIKESFAQIDSDM